MGLFPFGDRLLEPVCWHDCSSKKTRLLICIGGANAIAVVDGLGEGVAKIAKIDLVINNVFCELEKRYALLCKLVVFHRVA